MGIVYVVVGVVAVIVLRIAVRTSKNFRNIKTINDNREKEHADLADIEESKPAGTSLANGAHLTVVGRSYASRTHSNKENFASVPAAAIIANQRRGITGAELIRRVGA